jgi:hypothetical protein
MTDHELTVIQQNIFAVNDRVNYLDRAITDNVACHNRLSDQVSTMFQAMEKCKSFVAQINKDLGRINDCLSALESATKNETENANKNYYVGDKVYILWADGEITDTIIGESTFPLNLLRQFQLQGNMFRTYREAWDKRCQRQAGTV